VPYKGLSLLRLDAEHVFLRTRTRLSWT
jgi:hypothetical protein